MCQRYRALVNLFSLYRSFRLMFRGSLKLRVGWKVIYLSREIVSLTKLKCACVSEHILDSTGALVKL